jgi:hypothetical protein
VSQQRKCDRCGVVGDLAPIMFGFVGPTGWARLALATDEMQLDIDLCSKCASEVIDVSGLALAVKKAQAAQARAIDDGIVGGPMGPIGPMHSGPGAYRLPRRPWPPR